MNVLKKLTAPPWPALALGIPAFLLMALLHMTGLDQKDLFVPGHFAGIPLWILTAAMVLVTGLSLPHYSGKSKYGRMFPASTAASLGLLGAAAAVFLSAWEIFCSDSGILERSVSLLGLVAGAALIYAAWCRFRGLRCSFLLWSVTAFFLMLRLMLCYRSWSAQPELLRYCFPLFSSVCVTLGFYYRTAFSVGMGNRRMYLLFTQLGAFFCLTALGGGFDLFHLGMLLWCLLDTPSLRPMKTGAREALPEEQP